MHEKYHTFSGVRFGHYARAKSVPLVPDHFLVALRGSGTRRSSTRCTESFLFLFSCRRLYLPVLVFIEVSMCQRNGLYVHLLRIVGIFIRSIYQQIDGGVGNGLKMVPGKYFPHVAMLAVKLKLSVSPTVELYACFTTVGYYSPADWVVLLM